MFGKRAKFLVSPPDFDDIGAVLKSFGTGWKFDTCGWDELVRPKLWADREAVYLNCSGQLTDDSYLRELTPILREYVENGGTVYASDWALTAVKRAFPSFLTEVDNSGDAGTYQCSVADAGLREMLGPKIEINFDLQAWAMLNSVDQKVRLYVEADNLNCQSVVGRRLPVVIGFQCGRGHVLATSFHNEKQLSEREKRLLRFLALQPALASTASLSSDALSARNCKRRTEVIETIHPGRQSEPVRFESDGKPLLFVVNWRGAAELLLTIFDESGTVIQKRSSSHAPIIGEVANAAPGTWSCVVTGTDIPHKNFPYVLTIASADSAKKPPPPPRRRPVVEDSEPKFSSQNGPPAPRR